MIINNIQFNADLSEILTELKSQLDTNQIPLLKDIKDTPDNIMVTCPYHKDGQERKPSMGISKKDCICHCFTCGEVHSLQEFVTHCFGHYDDITGAFGWSWLLKNFMTISVEERKDVALDFARHKSVDTRHSYVSEEELDSYRYTHPYMYKRKLTDEIIELFDIGYDKASRCITFPVRDQTGKTLFVARRSVVTKFFNYPAGVEKPLYGLYEFNRIWKNLDTRFTVDLIVCESMIDALTCWVYGKYAVALNGLGNDLQFRQLRDVPCRKLILATDMDEAGLKARRRIKANVKNKLITEYKWDVKKAKDINDMDKDMFDNLKEVF